VEREYDERLITLAQKLKRSLAGLSKQSSEVTASADQPVLPISLFTGTRGYLEKLVHQINRCYLATCYDACSVMIRRLIEVLIIEAYLHHKREADIKNSDGQYLRLSELVSKAVTDFSQLSRNSKKALLRLKEYGDLSAHSIRYSSRREYIDDEIIGLRTLAEDLLYEAGLRK
jgi:uncharacterized protein DUF4145